MLRGENASAKSLHSVVQSLESDKVKLELKVKNLELQLKENKRQLSSSSGKMMTVEPPPPTAPCRGAVSGQDALLPDVALSSLALPPFSQRGVRHHPGPMRRGVPGAPTAGPSPLVLSVGRSISW